MKFTRSLGLRLALMLSVFLGILLSAGFVWLDQRSKDLIAEEEAARAGLAAESLVASLRSIMLAGHGDIAHDWMARVAKISDFKAVKVFRVDGTEAFRDLATLKQVNAYLGMERFSRPADAKQPEKVSAALAAAFAEVAVGKQTSRQVAQPGRLNYLYAIQAEPACLGCHGYSSNPVRGVLYLSVSTAAAEAHTLASEQAVMSLFIAIAALLGLGVWLGVHQQVLGPLAVLTTAARRIREGDLSRRVRLRRRDELGTLAATFNSLVESLGARIEGERVLRRHQQDITEAIISLSAQPAEEPMLERVADLARHMTDARYAMLSYLHGGERRLIPLGLTPEQLAALKGKPPQNTGVLGLIWQKQQTVRLDNVTSHALHAGFPEGHPALASFLGVPILFGDNMFGALYVADKEGSREFTEEDEQMLTALASAVAVALANTRYVDQLEAANSELEQRVAERTQALESANSRLRNREVELELVNEELKRASEAKNQFLANTSHELRTPLNAIIGFSELLASDRTGPLTDKQRRYVQHVLVSGKRLLGIINEILDISKIEAGMMEIQEELCLPAKLAKQVVDGLKPLAEEKGVQLTLASGREGPAVMADGGKMQHILINLVGNAIKFTPAGGEVSLSVDVGQGEGGPVLMARVKDTGIGIAPEDQERIFRPFVQGQGGLDRKHGGTGLGLSLSLRLARLLGGDISVTSEPGKGSEFTLEIPVRQSQGEAEKTVTKVVPAAVAGGQPLQADKEIEGAEGPRPRALIIDDNKARAASVAAILQEEGYDAVLTELGQVEALARELCPFFIMLGIPADAADTYNRLQQLKGSDITREIPVFLLGGKAEDPHFSMGTVESVAKDMGRNELLDILARHRRYVPARPQMHTVLVIDDDPSVRALLKEMLVAEGYHVLLSAGGEEGVSLAVELEPDLIILDLMMPGTTGFDVVEQLKRHPTGCDIPVVVYTAKDLTREDVFRLGQEVEQVLIKGQSGRADLLRELHKLELYYPVQARLIDPTLRCYNQRYMRLRLAQEVGRAKRYDHIFSLVGFEVDGFEAYTARHGARWGTAGLKAIMDMVQETVRRSDVLMRLSEQRFVLLLPAIPPSGAATVAEKLRMRIRHQHFPLPQGEVGRLTASFAAVHYGIDADEAESLQNHLSARFDEVLRQGGDRSLLGVE